jgi:hypothetical protein
MLTVRTLCVLVGAAALGLVPATRGATISTSPTAPTSNILTSQLTDLGPGVQANDRDYTDNGGPPGQTFTVPSAAMLTGVTILGRGDAGGGYNTSGNFHVQIATVDPATGAITQLSREAAPATGVTANNQYVTFTLANPVAVVPGTTYAWSVYNEPGGWFGLAHGTGDDYAVGTAFTSATALGRAGNSDARRTFHGFANPNPGAYDYVFAVQGVVPEPAALALFGVAGVLTMRRRRGA